MAAKTKGAWAKLGPRAPDWAALRNSPLQGNCRPICFQPTMLDFREQPLGMPKMETIYLHNPNAEEISLISISAATSHFHASFFENRIIQPGGNISFDVVFLARVVGNVENTLFINTSHHGVSTYQVFGVGVPNPYRLRPFIGARVPINSSFSPLINIHNPHSEPLQVVEMYSSGRDLHLELPPGQHGGVIYRLSEVPPFETKGVMRATFTSPDADNYTAFIRIKTNASDPDKFMLLPVEVEVASARGIYSSIHMLDFGTLRSQDKPKRLNLHLLNSGAKDVQITSIRTSPANDAVMIDFKPITLKAGEKKYAKIASISFDATKVKKHSQSSGKITVKTKEKSYNKLEIPYQAEVLEGYLGFDHTVTLFHIRDSVTDPAVRPIHLTNTFRFAISIHDVTLPDKAMSTFKVLNFSQPVLVPPQASWYVFSLEFRPLGSSVHIDDNILLVTNASKFHLPIRAYTGFLQPLVLPPSLKERLVDFGVLSTTNTSSILFAVINTNPIEVTGEHILVDLVETAPGNRTRILTRTRELHSTTTTSTLKTVIVASGYYAVFRVTLSAKDLEGHYDAAIHIPTDYQILTIPVKAFIAVGRLTSHPKLIVLPLSFPGKIVHQSFSIFSSFSQRLKLLHIRSLTDDKRFYYRRAKSSQDELEPNRRSKVAKIYFDASQQCGRYCYSALPFILKAEARPCSGLVMQEDAWDTDGDLYQMLSERWRQLKEKSEHMAVAVFEADADLQKGVQTTVSAQLEWPSILRCPRHVFFPLTGVNSSSEVEVPLENPADSVLYIQILPMALYPNIPKMLQMIPWERYPHFNQSSLEFQVIRNQTTALKSEEGFIEGSTQPFVYNLPLQPEERKTLKLQFSPTTNHTVTSLLLLRNNLTALEFLMVQGQGCYESIRVGGKSPGPGAFLRFKMVESHLKECTEENQPREPNFTLRRSFKMENIGPLPIHIRSIEINGRSCEGFGFKVNCQEFVLKPNASSDMVILFTPDFTASRVIRELTLTSARGSRFLFSLNASLPFHMLAACSSALPRPDWEAELYVLISVTMSSMLVLVMATAYLEALGIWEVFKKRMGYEAPGDSMETGKPFDLRDIVQLQGSTSPAGSRSTRGGHSRSAAQLPLAPYPLVATAPDSSASPSQHGGRKTRTAGCKHQQSPASVTAGYQGTSPLAGYQGASPLAGYQGASPLARYQGASPLAGYQGASPLAGYQGASPLASYQGASPLAGYQGASPLAGYQGASPLAGYQGASPLASYQGASPLASYQGASPLASYQGASPLAGYQGASPLAGYQGPSPLASYQGASPLAGYQGASPLAGYQGASPLAGYQGASPLAGYQGASPLAGYQGASPLAGYQGASPLAGYQGASPLAGYQGASPLAGYQGASPLVGYQGVSPLAGYQGASPLAGYQGASPLAKRSGHDEQDHTNLAGAMDETPERLELLTEELESAAGAQGKGKLQHKAKPQREERDARPKGKPQGEEVLREDHDDSSSTTTEASSNTDTEESGNKKSRLPTMEKDKEEMREPSLKSKSRKPAGTKEKSQASSSLELPYITPLENKRKAFNSKTVINQSLVSVSPAAAKASPSKPKVHAGNVAEQRPAPPPPSGSSSGSEGEDSISPPPEWDCVPLEHSGVDSLQQISMQTMSAEVFLKRDTRTPPPVSTRTPPSVSTRTPPPVSTWTPPPVSTRTPPPVSTRTPPPVSTRTPPPISTRTPPPVSTRTPPPVSTWTPPPVSTWTPPPVSTRTPPPVSTWTPPPVSTRTPPPVSTRTPPPVSTWTPPPVSTWTPPPFSTCFSECSSCSTGETGLNAAGSKDKLTLSVSLPGQYGNPTFAAVAAGYDKSPGGSSAGRGSVGRMGVAHMASVDSDCSDSPGLLSPIGMGRAPGISNAFSAFGTGDLFNLSGVLGGAASGGNEHQQSWPDFSHIYSSTLSSGSRDPLEPWNTAGHPPTSMLGSSSVWSSSPPPFSPSIWSTSSDSSPLHSFSPPASHLPHLIGCSDRGSSAPSSLPRPPPGILNPAYNPWSVWRPNFSGRGSEPWPRPPDNAK
ncbi:transmembrane protein 131 [Diretmus argenteus]